jgi:putative drug exporter of the RND superfamily
VFKTDPFDNESIETLGLIETWMSELLPKQAEAMGKIRTEVFGVTVHSRDMGRVVARDRLVVNTLVTIGVFIILLIIVKRWGLAAYLLATVLLSYYATLGATAIFTSVTMDKPFGMIEWRVPFFLFTILVAIGEDYNILLVTRIFQEKKRHGALEGTRRGLAATGGTITACGIIMAGTFGTLMLADLSTLKQIGFALAFGVLLDTLIVRPFMVPAFLILLWKEEIQKPETKPVSNSPIRVLEEVRRFSTLMPAPEPLKKAG